MKTYCLFVCIVLISNVAIATTNTDPSQDKSGFSLSDVHEFSMSYKSVDNLVVIPVIINDGISVNLILDTGCQNLILFGKRFQKLLDFEGGRNIAFSGLGSGDDVQAKVSLNNRVAIGKVQGNSIPIIVVPERNIADRENNIHGVIGYDIFISLEVEVHPSLQQIYFRSGLTDHFPVGYSEIPIRIVDTKPMLQSKMTLPEGDLDMDIFIDTGSILGLLLKSSDKSKFRNSNDIHLIGKGMNGGIRGIFSEAKFLRVGEEELPNIPVHTMFANHDNGSVGMGVLKNYSFVINYARGFVGLMGSDSSRYVAEIKP